MEKKTIMIGMVVGTTVGGYLPMLWGGSVLSVTSIMLGMVGGIAGVWAGYKLANVF